MSVLLFAEYHNGQLKKSVFEAATYAKDWATQLGTNLVAFVVGAKNETELASLGQFGVETVFVLDNPQLYDLNGQAYASALAKVAAENNCNAVVFAQTYDSKIIAPRLAVKMKAASFSGVISMIQKDGDAFVANRFSHSGKGVQTIGTKSDKIVVTLKLKSYSVKENPCNCNIVNVDYTPNANELNLKSVEVLKAGGKLPLTEADIVVSGGRGLKGPENWGMIEELADLLGAATACSKPVADVHWRPHHEHVGQTGIQIAPTLYIAVGISGAIQHLAGVSSSKTIVVVNSDPEAPFFKAADFGVVANAFDFLPQFIQAVKSIKG